MMVTHELILEILHIAEDVVEEKTTERVFFGYDDDENLTEDGQNAYDRIARAFHVAEIRREMEKDDAEFYEWLDGTSDEGPRGA